MRGGRHCDDCGRVVEVEALALRRSLVRNVALPKLGVETAQAMQKGPKQPVVLVYGMLHGRRRGHNHERGVAPARLDQLVVLDNALGCDLGDVRGCQVLRGEEQEVELVGFISLHTVDAGEGAFSRNQLRGEGLVVLTLPGALAVALLDLIPADQYQSYVGARLAMCIHSYRSKSSAWQHYIVASSVELKSHKSFTLPKPVYNSILKAFTTSLNPERYQ